MVFVLFLPCKLPVLNGGGGGRSDEDIKQHRLHNIISPFIFLPSEQDCLQWVSTPCVLCLAAHSHKAAGTITRCTQQPNPGRVTKGLEGGGNNDHFTPSVQVTCTPGNYHPHIVQVACTTQSNNAHKVSKPNPV